MKPSEVYPKWDRLQPLQGDHVQQPFVSAFAVDLQKKIEFTLMEKKNKKENKLLVNTNIITIIRI